MNIDHKRNKTYRFNQNQIFQLDKEHFWFYEIAFFLYELLNVYLIWITWYSNIWYLNQTCTSTICVDVNLVDILHIRFFGSFMINLYKLIKNDFYDISSFIFVSNLSSDLQCPQLRVLLCTFANFKSRSGYKWTCLNLTRMYPKRRIE